ncbi:MAG: hypothetical protein QOJ99_1063 [Bryobacterales bacterium]|jgi:hypothetical protein|nr:hypothetical protein [Bryobacterales bacterium]
MLASKGSSGVVNCHQVHRTLTAKQKPAFFRDRCLACHASLSVPANCPLADSAPAAMDCLADSPEICRCYSVTLPRRVRLPVTL